MARTKPLQTKGAIKSRAPLKAKLAAQKNTHDNNCEKKNALQAATLRALKKVRTEVDQQSIALSEWENDFIEGVSERVKTYGRAFADPEKGAMNGTLSLRQGLKLREISKKARGKVKPLSKNEE